MIDWIGLHKYATLGQMLRSSDLDETPVAGRSSKV